MLAAGGVVLVVREGFVSHLVGSCPCVGDGSRWVASEKGSTTRRTGGRVVKVAALRRGSDREQAARALVPSTRGRGRRSLAASLQVQVRIRLIPVEVKAIAFARRKTKDVRCAKKLDCKLTIYLSKFLSFSAEIPT